MNEAGFATDGLIDISFDSADIMDTSRRVLTLDQADLGMEREYLIQGLENPVKLFCRGL
jgi:hypothetical protein